MTEDERTRRLRDIYNLMRYAAIQEFEQQKRDFERHRILHADEEAKRLWDQFVGSLNRGNT